MTPIPRSARPVKRKDADALAARREVAAQKKIIQALAPLTQENRMRVLRVAAILHGLEIIS